MEGGREVDACGFAVFASSQFIVFFLFESLFQVERRERESGERESHVSRVSHLPLREARAHEYPEYHDYARESERRKTCERGCLTRLPNDVRESQQIIPSLTCLPSIVCPCFPPSIIRSIILSLAFTSFTTNTSASCFLFRRELKHAS